ncbi:hypothetical protein KSP35_06310 [Aquihabitans sp. G128]|uniref:hypothetical protein n=1 Tax=Aquihabitans sp. G128 TaxID=2849779 RepID=UPI001C22AF8F|nr:hypothetical protein [Aquihabitans sp. G128]QXC62410.1 hypothetical protein KSP35_06310 [Aquihabitans sp. G128]
MSQRGVRRSALLERWTERSHEINAITVDPEPQAATFHARDHDGEWWHRHRFVDGETLAWEEIEATSASIWHGSRDLIDLVTARPAFDPGWSMISGSCRTPLPPLDCLGTFGDRGAILPEVRARATWTSRCIAPGGDQVMWRTIVDDIQIRNVLSGHAAEGEPIFTFPALAYLDLRQGADPLDLFEAGGSIEGDLDDLLFISGCVGNSAWRRHWALGADEAACLRGFLLSHPGAGGAG